jgi:hypothetical protein
MDPLSSYLLFRSECKSRRILMGSLGFSRSLPSAFSLSGN